MAEQEAGQEAGHEETGRAPVKSVKITIPVPSGLLVENRRRRMHWGEYARLLREERERLYTLLLEALGPERPKFGRYSVAFTFRFKDNKKRDRDGLAQRCKVLLDCLCAPRTVADHHKLGIVPDDSDDYLVDYIVRRPEYGCERDETEVEMWEET